MSKHTSGKWKAKFDRGSTPPWSIPDVADIFGWKKGEAKANAHLIASAPELLEACKRAEGLICGGGFIPVQGETWNILRKAITKATGDNNA